MPCFRNVETLSALNFPIGTLLPALKIARHIVVLRAAASRP
jgi:hypothetical protein